LAGFGPVIAAVSKLIEALTPKLMGASPLLRPAQEARLSANFIEGSKKPEEKRTATEEGYLTKLQTRIIAGAVQGYLVSRTGLEGLKLAVVELTDNPNKPFYVGFHDQDAVPVWSVAKLLVVYAAYQLRHDLTEVAAQSQSTTQDELFKELKDQWAGAPEPVVRQILLKDPDPKFAKAGPPDLKSIFDIKRDAGGWTIDFKRSNRKPTDLELIDDKTQHFTDESLAIMESLEFFDRMRLMVGWSSDLAAATCVRDVGYPYMTALTRQSGLYNPGTGGLWLGGDYEKGAVAGPWRPSPVGSIVPAGTARALAPFMTLLVQGRLVDATASTDIRDLMEFPKTAATLHEAFPGKLIFSRSFFHEGLREATNMKALFRKIGMLIGATQNEAAIIDVDEELPRRYVLVALNAKLAAGEEQKTLFGDVAQRIDVALERWHATR
jgi:hypothetical protein